MPDAIIYCDGCNNIILPSAIKNGDAVVSVTKSLCEDCLAKLRPDERDELLTLRKAREGKDTPETLDVPVVQLERPDRRRTSGASSRLAKTDRAPSSSSKMVLPAIAIAGVLAGVAVVLVFAGGGSGEPTRRGGKQPVKPAAPVVTPPPTGPFTTASAAALQLAEIKAMRAPDLARYAEMRALLEKFPTFFADAPEAEEAKALLFKIEVEYAKLAEEALVAAITAAEKSASSGDFDGATSALESVASRFPDGPWLKDAGEAKIAAALQEFEKKRAEWEIKNAAATLEKALKEFEAGRLQEAGTLIAKRAAWPADVRAKADALATEIERKLAAIAAGKKLEAEREKILAEFDRLMTEGEYAAAREHAESKAAAGGKTGEMLRAAGRVARVMAEAPAARTRGAKTLIGEEIRLKLVKGSMTAIVKDASDAGLAIATTYRIGNKTFEKQVDLKWPALHAVQLAELARLGGLKVPESDAPIASTYTALALGDLTAAHKQIESARDHPLAARLAKVVRERQTQLAYESAMELAEELVEKKRWKAAKKECEKALEIKPDDQKAAALLAAVRRHIEPAPTLTLELADGVTMEFVYIRPGKFTMGGDSDPKHDWQGVEKPKHEVAITKGFYLGKHEVTQAQYEAVMGANPSKWKEANRPVEQVSWVDATEFCRKASEKTRRAVRLPTEAEWEFACRAGTTTDWSHGNDSATLGEYAWYNANAGGQTHAVGQKKPNAWGLYDMHGNVWEWVADWYDAGYYASSPREDPTGPTSGARRLLRGGSWIDGLYLCRSALRPLLHAAGRSASRGFRAAVSSPPRGP